MNVLEIINYARSEILDDAVVPYLWSDASLISHLNRAYEELARESKCIIDSSTASVCTVNLLANTTLHALSSKVVYVFNARRNSDGYPLIKKTEMFMEGYINWRASTGTAPYWIILDSQNRYFSIYPKYNTTGYIAGAADIQFVAATKKITKAGATFTSHFSTGDEVVITGTTSNNSTFTITNVADTELTVSETVVNESNTSAILKLVQDKALLRVARLPITLFTANDLALATPPTPEFDATYHYGLTHGIAKYAFLKPDSETHDIKASERHGSIFEQFKSDLALEMSMLMQDGNWSQGVPHWGTI
jgi:hypothetical protein